MSVLAIIVVAIVALLHFMFFIVESFLWMSKGPKMFASLPKESFAPTKNAMLNQGYYNAFLSAGLIWSIFISDIEWQANIALFFLGCVIIAGIVGAATVSRKIFVVQSVPAIIGVILVLL